MPRTFLILSILCLAALLFSATPPPVRPNTPDPGVLPTDSAGQPLNFDFETGTLKDWTATGDAFNGQPVHGDIIPRRPGMHSNLAGEWWIGTYEVAKDKPQGTLTSVSFKVTHPWASFLVGGGASHATRVEVVRAADQKIIFEASGRDAEDMNRVAVDLRPEMGKEIFIRVVDQGSNGWGHINFDDFRFHANEPQVPRELLKVAAPANALPIDTVKFAGLSPDDAVKAITLPPGFKVTLFAGEPDIVQPVAECFDDRGRLWVAEALTYPKKAPEGKGQDRILIFEDTKGTGHFDKRTVFMEGLNLVSGLEVGFGGIWVGQAPELLFIPILDGDKPGQPEVLLDGFGYQDTHETLNSFSWGPDGWLYGCHGVFIHSEIGKPGTPKDQRIAMSAGVWRYHPTKKIFEIFAEGGSNQWGIDWDDYGQAFITACVIPHLYHVFPGGRYIRQAGPHNDPYTFDDIKTIADHVHWAGGGAPHAGNGRSDSAGGGHAHCGAMIYLGDNWPAEYRNQIFMGNIHGNRMNEDLLEQEGSGYVGHHGKDFMMMNDRWARLIAEKYGPDGGVYVIDWYDKQACHLPQPEAWDRSNGRIYKVTYGDVKPVQVDLGKLSNSELMHLQQSPNDWYSRHARRILQERAAADPAGFRRDAINGANLWTYSNPREELRTIWGEYITGMLGDQEIKSLLQNSEPFIRSWAVQLAAEDHAVSPAMLQDFEHMAQSDLSPIVRLALAGAMQRLPVEQRWSVVEALLAHAEDSPDHNLPLMDWWAAEDLVPADVNRAAKLAGASKIALVRQFIARRLATLSDQPATDALTTLLGTLDGPGQLDVLHGMAAGFAGKRHVAMPAGWSDVYDKLAASSLPEVRQQALSLATLFGDPRALAALRKTLADPAADANGRVDALDALLAAKDAELPPILENLVTDPKLRGPAIRALATYDDPKTPDLILGVYATLDGAEKRDALNTLAARLPSAQRLLAALKTGTIPKADLTAPTVRNLSSLDDPGINAWIAESWGAVRATDADKAKEIQRLKGVVTPELVKKADPTNGRALFARTCMQCHTLFGAGAKIGPDLTGSNRADISYLLENIIDPSAVIGKDYLLNIIRTKDGRSIDGIIKAQNDESVTIATTTELLNLPKSEIKSMKVSSVSMMPEGLLSGMSDKEVRDLIAYLGSSAQVPMLGTKENASLFFDGRTLNFWDVDPSLWSVDNGELVGHTATGLKHNNFAFSQMVLSDFRLVCEIKLTPDSANSGIQFRSLPRADGEAIGYQADVGKGWWGKIYEENGRGLITKIGGEKFVKPNEWNTYEVLAVGSHVRLAINGNVCSEIDDPYGAKKGQTALQIHSGGPTEVHYRHFELEIGPKDEMKTVKQ